MVDVGGFFSTLIERAVVPLILVLLWGYAFTGLPEQPPSDSGKKGARAARWAALILFVLFVLSRREQGDHFWPAMPDYDIGLAALGLAALGAAIGSGFSQVVQVLKGVRSFPLLVLVLVLAMSVGLYGYFFTQAVRVPILFLSLGFPFGTLLYRAFSSPKPESAGKQKADT